MNYLGIVLAWLFKKVKWILLLTSSLLSRSSGKVYGNNKTIIFASLLILLLGIFVSCYITLIVAVCKNRFGSITAIITSGVILLLWGHYGARQISRNKNLGGRRIRVTLYMLSTYILLVITFAGIFWALRSFSCYIVRSSGNNIINTFFEYVYFSLVTASTLGYGEILPQGKAICVVVLVEVMLFWVWVVINSINPEGLAGPCKET